MRRRAVIGEDTVTARDDVLLLRDLPDRPHERRQLGLREELDDRRAQLAVLTLVGVKHELLEDDPRERPQVAPDRSGVVPDCSDGACADSVAAVPPVDAEPGGGSIATCTVANAASDTASASSRARAGLPRRTSGPTFVGRRG